MLYPVKQNKKQKQNDLLNCQITKLKSNLFSRTLKLKLTGRSELKSNLN